MDGSQPAKTLKDLNSDIRAMTAQLRNMDLSSDAWESHAQKLKDLKSQFNGVQGEINKTGNSYDYLKNQMKGVAIGVIGANLITSAAQTLTGYFTGAIDGVAKLSDEMADIRKVTGLAGEQLEFVNSQISKMDTRTSRSELRGLAYEAGKLGNQSVEDVLGFVAAADKINIALGEDLGADAVKQIGKLVDIFKLKEEFGLETGMLKIASSINDVGASSTASEGYLVDFLNRMAGVANIANISAPEIIGVAGTLDSLGQSSEVSTTVLSGLLTKMGADVPKFAKLAGVGVDEFRKTMENSGLDALLMVIKKVGKSASSIEEFSSSLGDLGVDGGRVVGVLGALAKNMDEVKRQTNIASRSFEAGTSILNEYNIKNETTAAKIEKLKKQINSLKESSIVRNAVQSLINGLQNLVIWLKSAGEWYDRNKGFIYTLVAATIAYNIVALKTLFIQKTAIAFQKAQSLLVNGAVIALKAMILLEELLTGQIKVKIALQRILNTTMLKNPHIAVTAALIALGGAIATVISKQRQLKKELQMEEVKINIKVESNGLDQLKGNLQKLQKDLNSATGDKLKTNQDQAAKSIDINKNEIERDIKAKNELQKKLDVANAKLDEEILTSARDTRSSGTKVTNTDNITKMKLEIKKREKLIKEKQKTLTEWSKLNQQYIAKINEEATAAKEAAQKREAINKEELERIKKLNEEYQKALEALQKLRGQALVQVIDDEFQRELAQLQLNHDTKMDEIKTQVDDEIALAKKLGKSKAEINQLNAAALDIRLGQEAEFNRQVKSLEDKRDKDLAQEEYQQELDNLAKRQAGRQILLNESYKNGEINAEQYQDALATLEVQGKEILIDILKDYAKDATGAELELSNMILGIVKDKNAQRYSLELAAAEKRLAIAQMNVTEANNTGSGKKGASKELYEAQSNLLLQQIANELGLTELSEQQKFDIKAKYAEKFDQLTQEYELSEQGRKKEIAQQAFETFSQFGNEILSIRSQKLEEELSAVEAAKTRESEILEQQKEKGFLTDAEYQLRKEKMEDAYTKKQNAIKRKQAVNDKLAGLLNVGIQTAVNITTAFPDPLSMILAAALGAIQAAAIASKKVPEFGKGNRFSDKILTGPSHASTHRGIQMIDPRTGELVALAEGGEVLLSKKTYQNNPELVNSLLDSSMNNNGQSISAPGYYTSSTPIPTLDSASMTKKVRSTTMMRNGGFFNNTSSGRFGTGRNPATGSKVENAQMQKLLERNTQIMEKIYNNGVEAYFDYQKYEVQMDKQKTFKERTKSS